MGFLSSSQAREPLALLPRGLARKEVSRNGHDTSLIWAGKEAVVALR